MQTEYDGNRLLHGGHASQTAPLIEPPKARNHHAQKPKVNDHWTSKGDSLNMRNMTLRKIADLSGEKWSVYPEWLEGITWTRSS